MSGHVAASHSLVKETLTDSPSSPISLILNRILLVRAPSDRRESAVTIEGGPAESSLRRSTAG